MKRYFEQPLKFSAILALVILFCNTGYGQQIENKLNGSKISFRGLSVVSDNVIWASGNKGTVVRSKNGGKTWDWLSVKGYENIDFRDIEAFDDRNAIIMGVASPAYILKTVDGGKTWKKVYENKDSAMFLDAMYFYDEKNGVVVGDPINHKPFVAKTVDGGLNWTPEKQSKLPEFQNGEAFFAASGSNVFMTSSSDYAYVTGGKVSRLFINGKANNLPLTGGSESTGANSLLFDAGKYVVIGGDFNNPEQADSALAIVEKKKIKSLSADGYKSSIEFGDAEHYIACGLTGISLVNKKNYEFREISETPFHVIKKARKGTAVFAAGPNGNIARIML